MYQPHSINAVDFGVVPDGATDNTAALNAAIAVAIASSGPGTTLLLPPGEIRYGTPLTLPDQACTLKIVGSGRSRSFTAGANGDPNYVCGTQLTYTGSTGDAFGWTLTGTNKRVYLTLENLTILGNSAGSSGHGVHLKAAGTTIAFLACYRDVTVLKCKQNNIFHDGNVFECQLYNVRSNLAGDNGFRADANTGGIPGETRFFGGTFNSNGTRGIRLQGGGTFSLHGVTCTTNTNEGLYVDGVSFYAFDLQLEANTQSSLAGDQAMISTHAPVILGCTITVAASSTGKGLNFVGAFSPQVYGLKTNSTAGSVGAAYKDVYVDDACRTATLCGYLSADFLPRIYLGSLGGHNVHNGQQWFTGQSRGQDSAAATAPDARSCDSFQFAATGATLNIGNPLRNSSYHEGQRIAITVYNNSGGALTLTWGTDYLMAAFAAPANGKRKSILFEWQGGISKWVQIGSASPDL